MPRPPEVFVHELEPEQAQRLVRIARTSKDRVRLRRAGIVLASVQGRPVSVIAQMFAATEGYVREVIHAFNDTGFAALDPKWSGDRPRKYGPVAHQLICQTARATPSALGLPFTTWSLWGSRMPHLPLSSGIGRCERSGMIAAASLQLRMPIPVWDPNPRA